MKRLGWIVAACLILMSSWNIVEFSSQQALNALLLGRKAFWSFDDGAGGIVTRVTKFGFNRDVDAAAIEFVGSFGGPWLQKELSAETLTIVSTSANDAAAGTGARQLLLQCIGSDGLQSNVVVTLNGLTPVVTTDTCKFINRAVAFSTGTSDMNEGNISIVQTTSGVQLAEIPADKSSTQQLLYYVPADRRCYMDDVFIKVRKLAGGGDPKVELNILIYSQTQDTIYDIREYYIDTAAGDGIIKQDNFKAEQLRPNEIITIVADTNVNDTIVTGSFDLTCKID